MWFNSPFELWPICTLVYNWHLLQELDVWTKQLYFSWPYQCHTRSLSWHSYPCVHKQAKSTENQKSCQQFGDIFFLQLTSETQTSLQFGWLGRYQLKLWPCVDHHLSVLWAPQVFSNAPGGNGRSVFHGWRCGSSNGDMWPGWAVRRHGLYRRVSRHWLSRSTRQVGKVCMTFNLTLLYCYMLIQDIFVYFYFFLFLY